MCVFFYRYYTYTCVYDARLLYNPLKKEHVGKININRKYLCTDGGCGGCHRCRGDIFVRVFAVKSVIYFFIVINARPLVRYLSIQRQKQRGKTLYFILLLLYLKYFSSHFVLTLNDLSRRGKHIYALYTHRIRICNVIRFLNKFRVHIFTI